MFRERWKKIDFPAPLVSKGRWITTLLSQLQTRLLSVRVATFIRARFLSLSLSLSLARARGRVFNIVGRSSMKGIHLWWEKKPWPLWSYNDISFDSVSKLLPCCVAEMKYGERYDSRRGSSTRNLPFSLIFERRKRIRSLIKLNDAALSWVIRKGSGSRFDERSALG